VVHGWLHLAESITIQAGTTATSCLFEQKKREDEMHCALSYAARAVLAFELAMVKQFGR
jgi:hypothetical protein